MLYVVQPGDTLFRIAARFRTTVPALLRANLICRPELIFPGRALIVPEPGLDLPLAGAGPYYIVQPGDTLGCLAARLGAPVEILARNNQIADPNLLFPGQELLVIAERPDPQELQRRWAETGGVPCEELTPLAVHGIYYQGSFLWEALGPQAVPALEELLAHPCEEVRAYAAISLGRIGRGIRAATALRRATGDADETVRRLAGLALRRLELVARGGRRWHVATGAGRLHAEPDLASPSAEVREGDALVSVQWRIPSPTGEEGPRGGLQVYDRLLLTRTGQVGYLPRVGFDQLALI